MIEEIEDVVKDFEDPEIDDDDPLKKCLTDSIMEEEEVESEEVKEMVRDLKSLPDYEKEPSLELKREEEVEEEKPKLELKQLPNHLRYSFLDEQKKYPVIINASLNSEEEEKLLKILRKYKQAIGWTIDDIKGISPAICMHKILMEDEYKHVVQPQRRLNTAMQEYVRNEFVMLLVA